MATVFTNGSVYWRTQEIGGAVNEVSVALASNPLPSVTLADAGVQSVDAGIRSASAMVRGFDDGGDGEPERTFRSSLGSRYPLIVGYTRPFADGDEVAIMNALGHLLQEPKTVGELADFTAEFSGDQASGWGTLLKYGSGVSGTGNGTEYNVGTVAAGAKRAFAALICTSASGGGSLDVTIESDATGFASPTTRFTFTSLAGVVGSEMLWLDGAITDDFWRATWATGVGTYSFVVAMGII